MREPARDPAVHSGGCLCGAVRFVAAGEPRFLCICHCNSCRRATGALMVGWGTFESAKFRITQGQLSETLTSPGVRRGHCAQCGSSITYRNGLRADEVDVTLATLDAAASLRPTAHIWLEDKLPWVEIADGLPQYMRVVPDCTLKEESNMATNTIRIHRVLRAPPERVYRAFLDADAYAKWLPPNGFTARVHHMDARVGGTFRMSFANFSNGGGHSFGGEYLELVPYDRIHYTDKFDDPNLPGVMHVTVTFRKVSVGTELNVVQEGVPDVIPAEACYLGWQESLILLAKLVEADIPA
jgi:uncharacterized protein YndB with AHSA1/START domain